MKSRWAILIAAALLSPSLVDRAFASPPSGAIKQVQHLSFLRESAAEQGSKFKLLSVRCASSRQAYIYVCNFEGSTGKQHICAATYVHYQPGHTGHYKVNFWGQSWPCGSKPPVAPPAYPGDGGPKS